MDETVSHIQTYANLSDVESELRAETLMGDDEIKALIETGEVHEEPWEPMDGKVSWIRMTKLETQ